MKHWILMSLLPATMAAATFTGFVTDSMCGNDHNVMKIAPDAKCVTDCVKLSKTVKYALYDGKQAYTLSDQQAAAKFAAKKVRVKGTLDEKTKTIRVESIEAASAPQR